MLTGSSTMALNNCPALDASASMSWVKRTLKLVFAGTVIVGFGGGGAGADARVAGGTAAGFGGGAGGATGLRAENSMPIASSIGISETCPLSSRTRTARLSAPMNVPATILPERSLTRSAESVTPTASTSVVVSVSHWTVRRFKLSASPSFRLCRHRPRPPELQNPQQQGVLVRPAEKPTRPPPPPPPG